MIPLLQYDARQHLSETLAASLRGCLYGVVLLCSAVGLAQAQTPAPPSEWQRAIQLPDFMGEELIAVPLDAEVFEKSADNWQDLRIENRAGQPQPFVVRRRVAKKLALRREYQRVTEVNLRLLADGLQLEFTVPPEAPIPQGIRLLTPLQNFEQRMQVFAGEAPAALVEQAEIFDYTQYMDVRNVEVQLPATTERRFRVLISNPVSTAESPLRQLIRQRGAAVGTETLTINERPFRIDALETWTTQEVTLEQEPEVATHPALNFRQEYVSKGQLTYLTFDTFREPVLAVTLLTTSRNFSRGVRLEDLSDDPQHFRNVLGQFIASSLKFRDLDRQELKLNIPETRSPRMRLEVSDQDNPPLEFQGVLLTVAQYELLLLAQPGESYRLLYGGEPESRQYDTAALNEVVAREYAPYIATLLPQAGAQPIPASVKAAGSQLLNSPWLLGGIAIGLAVFLGWGLFRAAQKFDQSTSDNAEPAQPIATEAVREPPEST